MTSIVDAADLDKLVALLREREVTLALLVIENGETLFSGKTAAAIVHLLDAGAKNSLASTRESLGD